MTVIARLDSGNEVSIPNVKWHPAFKRMTGTPGYEETVPAGLYAIEEDLLAYWQKTYDDPSINRDRIHAIEVAEAPLHIYTQTEDKMPFRHFGTLVKDVSAGMIMSLPHTWKSV